MTDHTNPDPELELVEQQLVAGWCWALGAAPVPLAAPTALGRTAAYAQRGREVEALIVAAHGFEPRLGERVPA
jgi:hypothetical protein